MRAVGLFAVAVILAVIVVAAVEQSMPRPDGQVVDEADPCRDPVCGCQDFPG